MVWHGHSRVNPPSRTPDPESSILGEIAEDDEDYDWRYVINNQRLYEITKTTPITTYYEQQQINWISHVIRRKNHNVSKILTFHSTKRTRLGRKSLSILERCVQNSSVSQTQFLKDSFRKNNMQGVTWSGMIPTIISMLLENFIYLCFANHFCSPLIITCYNFYC